MPGARRFGAASTLSLVMALASNERTRTHSSSSTRPTGRALAATVGELPLNAEDNAIASVQPSHWLSRSDSDCLDSGTSTSARRANKRMRAGPLSAVRWEACNIAPEAKKSAVYTLARWRPLWFDPGGGLTTRFDRIERLFDALRPPGAGPGKTGSPVFCSGYDSNPATSEHNPFQARQCDRQRDANR